MTSTQLQWGFRTIDVPFDLLFSKELTPAAKLLWIRLRFDETRHGKRSHHPRQLVKRTCLARSTVYEALRQGTATGWLVPYVDPVSGKRRWKTACLKRESRDVQKTGGGQKDEGARHFRGVRRCQGMREHRDVAECQGVRQARGVRECHRGRDPQGVRVTKDARVAQGVREPEEEVPYARIPVDLIRAAHVLRPQAILCYGLLQATPKFNLWSRAGEFKWAEFCKLTGLHPKTIKKAVRALAETGWIAIVQSNRRARIQFRLQHADEAYKEEARQKLEHAGYVGEALMRSFLSLITDTKECEDGARPEFLVNPASGAKMEFDRYYPVHRVAFEFNGKQHYVATGRFTKQQVAAQRKRDRLKQRICKERNVNLVVVHAEDLSLAGMLKKVGDLLPRRVLRGFKQTIRYLNRCGLRYQRAAKKG